MVCIEYYILVSLIIFIKNYFNFYIYLIIIEKNSSFIQQEITVNIQKDRTLFQELYNFLEFYN